MQEKWAYDPSTFNSFARHWKTGAPVPEAMFKQVCVFKPSLLARSLPSACVAASIRCC